MLEMVAELCVFALHTARKHLPPFGIKFFSFAEFGM